MEDPSILDYLKSIFKNRRSLFGFLRSLWDSSRRPEVNRALKEQASKDRSIIIPIMQEEKDAKPAPAGNNQMEPQAAESQVPRRVPWRSLLGVLLALLGQAMLEPPGRKLELGLPLFLAAAGFILWSCLRGEWRMAESPPGQVPFDPLTVRFIPLVFGAALAVWAFIDFHGNLFTWHNLLFWFLSIGSAIYAFWFRGPSRQNSERLLKSKSWRAYILPVLMIVGTLALIFFFRFFKLSDVAPEMTSDHAEKLSDVYDILRGKFSIYFPRNTGREPLYIYLTALLAGPLGLGLTFQALKVAAIIGGLGTLVFIYFIGMELGSKWTGYWAALFCGIAYWPIVIERFGLRISFYPLFTAATLFFLLRGLRRRNRNDFILTGIALGMGLMGYTPFRIMPFVVVIAFGVFLLHRESRGVRKQTLLWLGMVVFMSLLLFLPLLRYWMDNPDMFAYRAFTRLGSLERPLPGPVLLVFFSNLWNGLKMFNWDNGVIWVHSVPGRPAMDVVSGALFLIGVLLLLIHYIRRRYWLDLFLLISIPMLLMPSILSLAFPSENPAMNRAAGGLVTAFLLVGVALASLFSTVMTSMKRNWGKGISVGLAVLLVFCSAAQNFDLVFHQYASNYRASAWNTREMGKVLEQYFQDHGSGAHAWIVPYPYWVDTRLPALWAGMPERGDMALSRDNLLESLPVPGEKLFIFDPEDSETQAALEELYPLGVFERHATDTGSHDFMVFFVSAGD